MYTSAFLNISYTEKIWVFYHHYRFDDFSSQIRPGAWNWVCFSGICAHSSQIFLWEPVFCFQYQQNNINVSVVFHRHCFLSLYFPCIAQDSRLQTYRVTTSTVSCILFMISIFHRFSEMWNVKHKIQLIYTEGIFREQKIPDVGATDRDRYSRVMINFHSIIMNKKFKIIRIIKIIRITRDCSKKS